MKPKKCGCRYEGPVQTVSCAKHNAPAKNLNKAQAVITKLELRIEKIQKAWKACRFGTFQDGPASPTPDRCGIAINFGDDKVTVHEGKLGRDAILKLGAAIRGDET
jgi:hypothetical protein